MAGGDAIPVGKDVFDALPRVLAAVGSGVAAVRPGDLAALGVRKPCADPSCSACRAGRQDFCRTLDYAERGIKVSCLCPQGVRTPMLLGPSGNRKSFLLEGSVSPEDVAARVVEGIAAERFLILPHPEVADYERRKTADRDRWLGGMRRLRSAILADPNLRGDD